MFRKITSTFSRKYSLKYYEKYKKVRKKLPFIEPIKEHFITHNIGLFIKNSKYPVYHTDMVISYPDIPFRTLFKKIRQKYGNPSQYAVYRLNEHVLSIAAFKSLVLSDDNKIVLYFFNEELVEFEYILFHLKEKEYKEIVQRVIIGKYLAGQELSRLDGFYIEDDEKNQISVHWNGFDLSIKFLTCYSDGYKQAFMDYYHNTWKQKKKEPENGNEIYLR
jgi:hypothetical protein